MDATGTPLPDATVDSIRKNRIALKGPLTTPVGTGFRSVNVGLRKEFELFANVRPARTIVPGGRFENVDIVLVREKDGPPVTPPSHKGFGSRVIERGLAHELEGTVHLDYRADGLVCTVFHKASLATSRRGRPCHSP